MDYRYLQLWGEEAKKKILEREIMLMKVGHYAQADQSDFSDRLSQLEWTLFLYQSEEVSK
jgi:hypothetical protein